MPLEDQIARLERSLRWQRLATVIALALAAVAVVLATRPRSALLARSFQVVNDDGQMIAQLGIAPDGGGPFLKFVDAAGGPSMMLASTGGLAWFRISSRDGKTLLSASADKDGKPLLSLSDNGQKAILGLDSGASPMLSMVGGTGRFVATPAHLSLRDSSGKSVFLVPAGGPPESAGAHREMGAGNR